MTQIEPALIHLTLETSTRNTSICLTKQGSIVADTGLSAESFASVQLIPQIKNMLTDSGLRNSDIDSIAISIGPGSFTGLRTGVVTAKSLAYAANCTVVPVSTHEILAFQCLQEFCDGSSTGETSIPDVVATVIEAQRGQWFAMQHRRNEQGVLTSAGDSRVVLPQEFIDSLPSDRPVLLYGSGITRHQDQIVLPENVSVTNSESWTPRARSAALLVATTPGRFPELSPFELTPEYGRKSAAEEKLEQRQNPR